jgi:hypothetical protein
VVVTISVAAGTLSPFAITALTGSTARENRKNAAFLAMDVALAHEVNAAT